MPNLSHLYDTSVEAPAKCSHSEPECVNLRLLWVVTLDPTVAEHHGAGMRFLNFARELSKAGAQVYFAANVWNEKDRPALEQFLSKLKSDGVIAGSILTDYRYSVRRGRIGALGFYPGLTDWLLRDIRRKPASELLSFAREHNVNVAIVSDRMLMFLGAAMLKVLPTVFDWTDSMALYYWRALKAKLQKRNWAGFFGFLRDYQTNVLAEAYYGRRATLNTIVSPVDKAWLDRTNFASSRNRVWMNGTNTGASAPIAKIPKRLIFSGAMDYAPNYEGALWFINEVLPLILRKHPDARLVVAGVNPPPELLAKANEQIQITGFVPDLSTEIARSSLYVAPLLSGGGFRNKVIEAIMQGTYLVGTSISVEFLPQDFQALLSITDTANAMAHAVIDYLDDPTQHSARLDQLREIVVSQYSWRGRTHDLVRLISDAQAIFAKQRA